MTSPSRSIAVGILALAVMLTPFDVPAAEPVRLKMHITPFLSYAPFFIAQEEGYFADEGIEVEFIQSVPSTQTILMLAHGDLDVWAGGINWGVLNTIARGGTVRLVAGKGYVPPEGCSYMSFLAGLDRLASGELKTAAGLKGRRVGVVPAGVQAYYLARVLEGFGLGLDDVEMLNLPNPVRLQAMGDGSLDLAITGEPWVTRILDTGRAKIWKTDAEDIPGFQFGFVGFGKRLLQDDPETGKKFIKAYLKGIKRYNEGKTDRNLAILSAATGLERDILERACWPAVKNDGRVDLASLRNYLEWARQREVVDTVMDPDKMIAPEFADYANDALAAP